MRLTLTIWKFPFALAPEFTVSMPRDARIVSVQVQRETPCIWAVVDPDKPKELREFVIVGTGHEFLYNPSLKHLSTFQTDHGKYVWHLFEAVRA